MVHLVRTGPKDQIDADTIYFGGGTPSARWNARQAAMLLADSAYSYDATKSKKDENRRGPAKVTLLIGEKTDLSAARSGMAHGQALAGGMALTKELGNLPANICTPTYLAQQAKALGKSHKLKVDVLDRAQMEKLGMGSLLSVATSDRMVGEADDGVLGAAGGERLGGRADRATEILVGEFGIL